MAETGSNPLRILVTNDDGIHAPGLKVLETIARGLGNEVWVVAPETNQSGASHSLTLSRPLRIRRVSERRFAVDGTPTDCVLLALQRIVDGPVTLLLSGVNQGSNLAEDVTYSGTVAAAMEATVLGVPAIAISQACRNGHPVKWHTAETHAPGILRRLWAASWPEGVLINVNFPDRLAHSVRGLQVTCQGKRKIGDALVERIDPRGEPYYWIGAVRQEEEWPEGTDLAAIAGGYISITPVHLDLTHHESLMSLRKMFQEEIESELG